MRTDGSPGAARRGMALTLGLIALLASGCSSVDPGGDSSGPVVEATDLYTDQTPGPDDRSEEGWESLTLSPLGWLVPYVYEMLGPTPEQEVVIAQGSYALLRHCMAERGFKLFDAPPAAVPVVPRARGYDVRIGIMSGERARQTGYQLRKDDFGTGGDTGGAGLYPEWTREYEEALKGDGGCVFVSDDALAEGVVSTAGRLASEIDESSLAEAWASPAVESALVQWRSCMAEEGYAFTDPQEAYRSFRGFAVTTEFPEAGDSTAASTEIETAVRDAFCKAEIGFPRLWQQQLMEIRQAMVQENLPALQVYVAATAQWVANAQALIARYG